MDNVLKVLPMVAMFADPKPGQENDQGGLSMRVVEVVVVQAEDACEVFCKACGQLRLWAKGGTPAACGACQSAEIVTGPLNGDELVKMRTEWRRRACS